VDHAEDALEQLTADYEHAKEIQVIDPTESLSIFRKIAFSAYEGDEFVKLKERSIQLMGKIYANQRNGEAIDNLLKELRPLFSEISKAKAAKLVRVLIDAASVIPDCVNLQVAMCTDSILGLSQKKELSCATDYRQNCASCTVNRKSSRKLKI